jgi:hypothetical protein
VVYDNVVPYKFAPLISAFTKDALVKFSPLKSTPAILSPDKSTLGPTKKPEFILYPDPAVNTGGSLILCVIPDDFTLLSVAPVNIVPVISTFRIMHPVNGFDAKFNFAPIINVEFTLFVVNM